MEIGRRSLAASPTTWFVGAGTAAFFIFLIGILVSVVVDSFGKPWFNTWLPESFVTSCYTDSWERFGMTQIIGATLATVMYNFGLGRTLTAVILVNLVPSIPFVIMTTTPFIEQINPTIEDSARMSGASMRKVFTKILSPLLIPGILAASILVLVRTVGMFELTFLVSGPSSDTQVVAIYRAMTAAGDGEARQLVSSMAVVDTATMMVILIIALRFVRPTQLVARVKETRDD